MLNSLLEYVAKYGLNLLAALIILIIGKWVSKIIADISEKLMTKAKKSRYYIMYSFTL